MLKKRHITLILLVLLTLLTAFSKQDPIVKLAGNNKTTFQPLETF